MIIEKNGITRNIADSRWGEYEGRGWKKVEPKKPKDKPKE